MLQTSPQSEFAPERGVAPRSDAVSNFTVGEMDKPWSIIASQIWSGDSRKGDADNSKTMDFSVPKPLSDSLGMGAPPADVQSQLETRGLLPRTRIAATTSVGMKSGFVVQWGDGALPANGRQDVPEGARRESEPPRNQSNGADGRSARGRTFEPGTNPEQNSRRRSAEAPERRPERGRLRPTDGASDATHPAYSVGGNEELGKVYEMQLQNNTGRHNVDASVIIPKGYDPEKPTRMLIYNHGFRTDARAALNYSQLREQMRAADPQTVLVVPEWQANPGSNSSARGRSDQPNFYRNMFNEIMQKTPELQGKTVDNIASMGIIAHSAGYNPSIAQLYKNGLQDKITSLTVLDSMYNPGAYDGWIKNNLQDLAAGRKRFQLIYTGHLAGESKALEARVAQQLTRAGLGTESIYRDHGRGGTLVNPETMAQHGFVFKRSEFTNRGDGAHGAMTHVYLAQLLKSEGRSA